MKEKLELKPFVEKEGVKYKIIQITDIALHTTKKRPTPSHGKKLMESFATKEPGRIYSPIEQCAVSADGSFDLNLLALDEDFVRMVREEEAKGYKVLIGTPKRGIPIVPGDDTIEFMQSKNGKRVLRGLAKEKDKS